MEVKKIPVGPIGTNCYFVGDEATHQGCMVDPGDEGLRLIKTWREFGYTLCAVLITHGHYDHVTGLYDVARENPSVPIYVHTKDVSQTGECAFYQCKALPSMRYVEEGTTIDVGDIRFTVMETPGHTPGGVVFRTKDALFTGDTLFAGSCGRVDFPGSNSHQMRKSLRRLAQLHGDYAVYPGHEQSTTLERERHSNPFLVGMTSSER